MATNDTLSKIVWLVVIVLILFGFINSPTALLLGFLVSILFKYRFSQTNKAVSLLLKISVVGLGFGMYIKETLEASREGLYLIMYSIILTIGFGLLLTKILRLDKKLGYLISSGTAICGGSAIAAIAAVIKAKPKTISIALATTFILNSIALFIFPTLGHLLDLTQKEFGFWVSIAIHNTNSVVGAALEYGEEALKVATMVKLAKTLWIIPLSIISTFIFRTKGNKIKIPYFIILFVLAIVINNYQIIPEEITHFVVKISKRLMVLTLFLVGTTISIKELRTTGLKPMLMATFLWIFISIASLLYILYFY